MRIEDMDDAQSKLATQSVTEKLRAFTQAKERESEAGKSPGSDTERASAIYYAEKETDECFGALARTAANVGISFEWGGNISCADFLMRCLRATVVDCGENAHLSPGELLYQVASLCRAGARYRSRLRGNPVLTPFHDALDESPHEAMQELLSLIKQTQSRLSADKPPDDNATLSLEAARAAAEVLCDIIPPSVRLTHPEETRIATGPTVASAEYMWPYQRDAYFSGVASGRTEAASAPNAVTFLLEPYLAPGEREHIVRLVGMLRGVSSASPSIAPVARVCVAALAIGENHSSHVCLVGTMRGYELAGGGVEDGENYEAAMLREFVEETGLLFRPHGPPICILGVPKKGAEYTSRILVYRGTSTGIPVAASDAKTAGWFSASDVLAMHRDGALSNLDSLPVLLMWAKTAIGGNHEQ